MNVVPYQKSKTGNGHYNMFGETGNGHYNMFGV